MGVRRDGTELLVDIDDDIVSDDYWYGGISHNSIRDGIRRNKGQFSTATIEINSAGGDVTEGIAIRNELMKLSNIVPTTVRVIGVAASISSVIAMLPNATREIYPGAYFMIHRPWMFGGGDFEDFENYAKVLKDMNIVIADIYEAMTTKSHEETLSMMNNETWINYKDSVEFGFAQKVVEMSENKMMNRVNPVLNSGIMFNKFKNSPSSILVSATKTALQEPQTEGVEMAKIADLAKDDPEAMAELTALQAKAKASAKPPVDQKPVADGLESGGGAEASLSDDEKTKCKNIIASNTYNATIRSRAADVLSGNSHMMVLDSLVAVVDMQTAQDSSGAVQDLTDDLPETPAGQSAGGKSGASKNKKTDSSEKPAGFISNNDDLKQYLDSKKVN